MIKTAVVTGATSFLGGRLVKHLTSQGIRVHVIVRPESDNAKLPVNSIEGIHVHDGSIEALVDIFSKLGPDTVFHIAGAYARDHVRGDVARLIDSNIRFGTQILEAMTACGVRDLVNAGSAFQHFHADGYRPFNLYAATKQAFIDIVRFYEDSRAISCLTVILPDIYGAGDWRPKLMNRLAEACVSGAAIDLIDKSTTMALLHVDDAAECLFLAGQNLVEQDVSAAGVEYSADEGGHYSLERIVAAFEVVSGREIRANWNAYALPERQITEPWRGPSLPNWQLRVTLEAGIERLLDHAREARET